MHRCFIEKCIYFNVQEKMHLYPLKAIFIHLEISIKLLMFDLLYPTDHKIDRIFPFIYGLSIY